jgi:hypothetical protein
MMDAAALGAILRGAERDLFRLETLDFYAPDREGFDRWQAGDGLDEVALAPWFGRLRAERDRGLRRRRVHVLRSPLAPYLAYECELYARNAEAGEQVRILDQAERPVPPEAGPDFWAVDRREVVLMHYDRAGRFAGASLADPGLLGYFLAAADTAWDAAEPFGTWWPRHRGDRQAA